MKKFFKKFLVLFSLVLIMTFTKVSTLASESGPIDIEKLRGTEVTFYGWGGSEKTNAWIDGFLKESMEKKYGIKLKRVGMDIDNILNQLISEKEAKVEKGVIDVIWINGENFVTAKNKGLLFGEITSKIPNYGKLIDGNNEENTTDFGEKTEGFEVPYGRAQLVMILDGETIKKPIKSYKDLMEIAKENPGKITYPALPDFTGSAFVRNVLVEVVGYEKIMASANDENKLREVLKPGFDFLKELKPYLWKEGKTYPSDISQQDNLFSDGELAFTVSYNPYHILSQKESGHFPEDSFISVFDKGTFGNTHFVSIAFNSPNSQGAMLLINEIISAEAQSKKYDPLVWGDLPVIDNNKLSKEEMALFDGVTLGEGAISQKELLEKRLPELPVGVLLTIEKIWNEEIPK